ncbi:hypothetical protein TpMuguga_03g02180 [Theileria parva strain Muguga]|uniref:uncharacterized protein n=1 Tax=Theileria parva strain Muguga TaxID=333668 RepID=UPI001C61F689|nr:uncharacterized protein TpMuguga_03g02180 [Theileria parva strain Muguga]KAF5153156.1 hypothetical protein TpMuguga_03g02180 [Theileria parva strain Muguga]
MNYVSPSDGWKNAKSDPLNPDDDSKNSLPKVKIVKITHRGREAPIRYVFHEILRILAKHKKPLHFLELEKALRNIGFEGVNISTNKELLDLLRNNDLIEFNNTTKRLLYKDRYESIVSRETLHSFIVNAGCKGLVVDPELLATNPLVFNWINDLLKYRKIRVVRPNLSNIKGKKRCRFAGSVSQCGIYSSSKCQECHSNLEGLVLFPLGKDQFERDRFKIDHDVKNLWDAVVIPSTDQLLREYNITQTIFPFQLLETDKKKRKDTKGFKVKMRKIYNTHLFTPQELRGISLQED